MREMLALGIKAVKTRIFPFSLWAFLLVTASCVSFDPGDREKPPAVDDSVETEAALELSILHGGDVLLKTKGLLQKRDAWFQAGKWLTGKIKENQIVYSDRELIHAVNLYIACNDPGSTEMFSFLNRSQRGLAKKLSWIVAATLADARMAGVVERRLTELIESDLIDLHLMPEMADAVLANRLKSSYTIVREGLLTKGDPEFTRAMLSLEPARASEDFLVYLNRADFEDLRQISIPKINLLSTTIIFEHFLEYPPSIAQPEFSSLFLYAASRNRPLAEMANAVLVNYLPEQTRGMALILARMDGAIQLAFVEQARRNITSELRLFMEELKSVTAKNEVAEEISALL